MADDLLNGGGAAGDPVTLEENAEQAVPKQVRID